MTTRTPADDVTTTARLPATERLRREWYLFRFDWHMQDYPRKEFTQIKKDLRAQLTLAALDVGTRQALRDVGHPRVLAERYIAELGTRLPRWTTGVVTAGVAVGFVMYLMMAYSFGSLDTLDALGGGSVTFHPFGTEITLTHTEDEISMEGGFSWSWLALYGGIAAVTFLLGSRAWRAF